MKLNISNFAKVKNADMDINGITVIAGENNTGKSTIGKVLYCVFNAFFDIKKKLNKERINTIERFIDSMLISSNKRFTRNIMNNLELTSRNILERFYEEDQSKEYVNEVIKSELLKSGILELVDDSTLDVLLDKIQNILNVSDEAMQKIILKRYLNSEFESQLNNVNHSDTVANIELKIKDKKFNVDIVNNDINDIKNELNIITEAIYIDTPFVIDNLDRNFRYGRGMNHQDFLTKKLQEKKNDMTENVVNEALNTEKLKKVLNQITSISNGKFIQLDYNTSYQENGFSKPLNLSNLSTGLKTFIILQRLIENGYISENGVLILDEPEIHLHPEWQIAFAEILVLLQKELNLHIILNTHSPYFLNAIEVYSAKNKIADRCKYYLAELTELDSYIKDVTKSTELIYQKLAKPLQDLEKMQYGSNDDE